MTDTDSDADADAVPLPVADGVRVTKPDTLGVTESVLLPDAEDERDTVVELVAHGELEGQ